MKKILMYILLSSLVLVHSGFEWGEKKQFGESIPSNVQAAKLPDIVKNPQAYKDREVMLEGNYGFYCCPADFSYKEGLEAVNVSPAGFDSPKGKRGQPVKIYGTVRMGKSEPAEEEKEENEESHDFFIEAKGVQFK